jgi:hypothetical protein
MARIATFSPCTAAHRIGDDVGHVDGAGRFVGISSCVAGSVLGEDALRFVPAAMGIPPRPRPSASERGALGCLAEWSC